MSKKGQKDHKDTNLFVTNDDLKEFIHGIHNFMRNNGFGYGKDALETFNFFYGLKNSIKSSLLTEPEVSIATNVLFFCFILRAGPVSKRLFGLRRVFLLNTLLAIPLKRLK